MAVLRWLLICVAFTSLSNVSALLMDSEYNYANAKNHPHPSLGLLRSKSSICRSSTLLHLISRLLLENKATVQNAVCPKPKMEMDPIQLEPDTPLPIPEETLKGSQTDQEPELYVVKATPLPAIPSKPPLPTPVVPKEEDEIETLVNANITENDSVVLNVTQEEETATNQTEPASAEEIPSFREWTQKALEEEQKKREEEKRKREEEKKKMQQNLMNNAEGSKENTTKAMTDSNHGTHQIRLKKNFASLDCGAKVAAANAEAQSALNIITPSRDEYMLNKCSDKAWFVVELCESIKAFKIEIANFELYSSVPKDIRIYMGNVMPGRDKDWTLFGQFEAKDERSVQTFVSTEGVFGKYVKVEILSHHGTEHYCPVSLFKIYGISEIELIGADEDDVDDDLQHDLTPVSPTETPSDTPTLIKMFKEGFKLFVGVFAPNKQVKDMDIAQALNQTSLVGTTFMYQVSCPGCDANSLRNVYFLLAFNYAQLLQTLDSNSGLKSALSQYVCQSYGFTNVSHVSISVCASYKMAEFYATLFGTSRIMALCNVIGIQSGQWDKADSHLVLPPWTHQSEVEANKITTPEKHEDSSVLNPQVSKEEKKAESASVVSPSSSSISVSVLADSSVIAPSKVESEKSASSSVSKMPPVSTSDSSAAIKIDPTPASDQKPAVLTEHTEDKVNEPLIKDLPDVLYVPPVTTPSTSPEKLTESGQSGRESVWQKLSNKIKALERNVSLSSRYLEELSIKYKKQIEDLQLAVRQSGEALAAASKDKMNDRTQVKDLQEEVGQLKIIIEEVSSRMETMSTWAVVVHSLFLIVEIFVGILFVFACLNRRIGTPVVKEPSLVASTPLKRRHSHEEKSICLDEHHVQELKSVKRRRSLDLNAQRNSPLLDGLSKRQKKKLQRRLSRANAIIQDSSPAKEMHHQDWQPVTRSSPVVNLSNGSAIQLGNMFQLLNHSQHEDDDNPLALKKLLNGQNYPSRSATPTDHTTNSTPSHTSNRLKPTAANNKSKKRSKSTSPPRKVESSVAKQKDMFKKFDPENVDWMPKK